MQTILLLTQETLFSNKSLNNLTQLGVFFGTCSPKMMTVHFGKNKVQGQLHQQPHQGFIPDSLLMLGLSEVRENAL